MAILSRVWKQQSSVIAQEKSCFSVTPKKIRQGQNSVFIILTHPLQKDDIIKISVEKNGELFEIKSVKKRNPYILKLTVPENLTEVTSIVNILVEKNGSIIGSRPIKCESKLRELEQILRSTTNPVEFMCQALGFSPCEREQLDNWLVHRFQNNIPPHFNLIANCENPDTAGLPIRNHSHEEFPTLLHFAGKFGLEKLAMLLLDHPGGDLACEVRNLFDMTPLEMAESNGFSELAQMFRGYITINDFTHIYRRITAVGNDDYEIPRNMQQNIYDFCPAPRPVTISDDASTLGGYMTMKPVTPLREKLPKPIEDCHINIQSVPEPEHQRLVTKPKQKDDDPEKEDKTLKELVEIMNDFKNNIHSIEQAEDLVRQWESRNDVQMSFKEKQDQLMEMRRRYEQLQKMTTLKHPSLFERVKKVLFKPKLENNYKQNAISTPMSQSAPSLTIVHVQRPISSLSTSSSSSSGRSSRISGCSLGDSGTHSDNEERKLVLVNHSVDECRPKFLAELNNYNAVPAPKPVKNTMQMFETIPETRPDNSQPDEEYYIKYPPSGKPVPGLESSAGGHEYINYTVPGPI
ncbi:hypothetical protein JTB14_035526 [Gonioctena quinquepunctata]|nr:hypothetical protein JTB14_035526 [Gonioctena quinquepunctata]